MADTSCMKAFPPLLTSLALLLITSASNASQLLCGLGYGEQKFPALPEFRAEQSGSGLYGCEYTGKVPDRVGNWFPGLPDLGFWQNKASLYTSNDTQDTQGYSAFIGVPIKRLDRSTLYLHYQQQQWQQTLISKQDINYQPPSGAMIQLIKDQAAAF